MSLPSAHKSQEAQAKEAQTKEAQKSSKYLVQVVTQEVVNLNASESAWLPLQIQDKLKSNLQSYLGMKTVVDSKAESTLKKLQAASEEIGSSIVQGLGACIFIAATAILDTIALNYAKNFFTVTAVFYSLFGGSMILMYLFSLLQHALVNLTAKRVFNRLSHVWAFLNIGFGYSAYTITKIQGVQGWVIFGIVWAIAFTGIMFFSISGKRFEKLNIVFYVISGFTGIFACKTLYEVLSMKTFLSLKQL